MLLQTRTSYPRMGSSAGAFPPLSSLHLSEIPRRQPNPHGPVVYEDVLKDAQDINLLVSQGHYYDHVSMSAYLWPYASLDALIATTYFNVLGFYIDDTIGNDIFLNADVEADTLRKIVAYKALNILMRGVVPEQPDKYDRAFLHLDFVIMRCANPEFASRFYPMLFDHWQAAIINYEEDGAYQGSVEEFIPLRRLTSGMYPTIALIELANQRFMPEWLPEHLPSLPTVIDALADMACLSNDLFSYHKEVVVEGTSMNLVPIIQRQAGGESVVWAVHEAIALINSRYAVFKEGVRSLLEQADGIAEPGLRIQARAFLYAFIDGMWDQAAAYYHWQMEANRYRNAENPFSELRHRLTA